MEDLELLKKDWNSNKRDYKKYSENDIYKMIRKKSISLSMLLFFVGILEISLWMFMDYFYPFNYPIAKYLIFIVFVGLLIYGYFKIKNVSNSKQLMKNILNLRKYIIAYVIITISLILFDVIKDFNTHVHHLLAGWIEGEQGVSGSVNPDDVNPGFMSYLMFTLCTFLLITLLLFIYRKTYGKLLKKLKLNYDELTKLEESNI